MPSLHLSRATEADIDALIDPLFAAFKGNDLRTMFFGHDTPACRASAKQRIAASMAKGGQNVWLKVVDSETGRVVSGSWWMVRISPSFSSLCHKHSHFTSFCRVS